MQATDSNSIAEYSETNTSNQPKLPGRKTPDSSSVSRRVKLIKKLKMSQGDFE